MLVWEGRGREGLRAVGTNLHDESPEEEREAKDDLS